MENVTPEALLQSATAEIEFPDGFSPGSEPQLATIICPGLAILPFQGPVPPKWVMVRRRGKESWMPRQARLAVREDESGFMVFAYDTQEDEPGIGLRLAIREYPEGRLVAAQAGDSGYDAVIGSIAGLVDTSRGHRWEIRFGASQGGTLAGSPLISGNELIGVIEQVEDRAGGNERWIAIPLEQIMRSEPLQRLVPDADLAVAVDPDEPAERDVLAFDDASFFARLSSGALQVLAHAEGLRTAQRLDQLHMDQLLLGLAQIKQGATESVLRAAGISESRLRNLLNERNDVPLPPRHTPIAVTALPRLSKHTRHALANARELADGDGSAKVEHRHLLLGALAVRHCGAVDPLLRAGLNPDLIFSRIPELRIGGSRVGGIRYHSDLPTGADHLGVTREAQALAGVIVAKSTPLPLSIGLLGDWGSGKSFFMKRLEDAVGKQVGEPGNCKSVVQLWFNAWHYIDTNLWASLAASIFEGLAAELDKPGEEDREARAELKAQILERTAHLRQVQESAESRQRHLTRELGIEEERLRRLEEEERTVSSQLSPRELAKASYRYVVGQPGVKDKLDELSDTLGLDKGHVAVAETRAELLRLTALGRKIRIAREMVRAESPIRQIWLTLALFLIPIAALLLAGGGLAAAVDAVLATRDFAYVREITAAAVTTLAAAVAAAGVALRGLRRPLQAAWGIVAQAKRASDEQLREARNTWRTALQARRDDIRKARADTEQQIRATEDELDALAAKLAELHPDRRLGDFVRTRSASTDYTQHLGVIARARGDFQKLTERLQEALKARADSTRGEKVATIDRIILYIDDLDRCPEDKVVDVLQAVHLLLAFELFVVVVGVDSRWLLHSLRRHSRALGSAPGEYEAGPDAERAHWKSTPLNYLEKIFQIPLTLRPMGAAGYHALVNALSSEQADEKSESASETEETSSAGSDPPPASGGAGSTPAGEGASTGPASPHASGSAAGGGTESPSAGGSAPPPDAARREVQEWERKYLTALYPLIPTPRAAKRFLNVYRLIRGGLDLAELRHVAGSEAGQFRVVLLLLAMLTGYPAEATVVLRGLTREEPDDTWWNYLDSLAARRDAFGAGDPGAGDDPFAGVEDVDPGRWEDMLRKLRSLRTLIPEDYSCEAFVKWAPEIGRYSFHSGRLVGARFRPFFGAAGLLEPSSTTPSAQGPAAVDRG